MTKAKILISCPPALPTALVGSHSYRVGRQARLRTLSRLRSPTFRGAGRRGKAAAVLSLRAWVRRRHWILPIPQAVSRRCAVIPRSPLAFFLFLLQHQKEIDGISAVTSVTGQALLRLRPCMKVLRERQVKAPQKR